MEFRVERGVLDLGVKIVFGVVEGFDNTEPTDAWMSYRNRRLSELVNAYRDFDPKADPVLEGFNILHDKSGVKRRKNVPASTNLIKMLEKHDGLTFINTVVDIYNLVSVESKLALGAHDMDHIDGNFTLRFTDGTERYVPLGQIEPRPVRPHEYCYCDDANEVLCRLEVRQVNKTAVTESTTRAAFIVQGNAATSNSYVRETAEHLVEEVACYCGGQGRVVVPTVIG